MLRRRRPPVYELDDEVISDTCTTRLAKSCMNARISAFSIHEEMLLLREQRPPVPEDIVSILHGIFSTKPRRKVRRLSVESFQMVDCTPIPRETPPLEVTKEASPASLDTEQADDQLPINTPNDGESQDLTFSQFEPQSLQGSPMFSF